MDDKIGLRNTVLAVNKQQNITNHNLCEMNDISTEYLHQNNKVQQIPRGSLQAHIDLTQNNSVQLKENSTSASAQHNSTYCQNNTTAIDENAGSDDVTSQKSKNENNIKITNTKPKTIDENQIIDDVNPPPGAPSQENSARLRRYRHFE